MAGVASGVSSNRAYVALIVRPHSVTIRLTNRSARRWRNGALPHGRSLGIGHAAGRWVRATVPLRIRSFSARRVWQRMIATLNGQ